MPLTELLQRSSATQAFKDDVLQYAAHAPAERIAVARHSPRVKVLRVLAQLLDAEPTLAIEHVHVDATSSCSTFRGVLSAECDGVQHVFDFTWDCAWRAESQGWTDYFGLPDQIRAAREFGYRCFSKWEERESAATAAGARTS